MEYHDLTHKNKPLHNDYIKYHLIYLTSDYVRDCEEVQKVIEFKVAYTRNNPINCNASCVDSCRALLLFFGPIHFFYQSKNVFVGIKSKSGMQFNGVYSFSSYNTSNITPVAEKNVIPFIITLLLPLWYWMRQSKMMFGIAMTITSHAHITYNAMNLKNHRNKKSFE